MFNNINELSNDLTGEYTELLNRVDDYCLEALGTIGSDVTMLKNINENGYYIYNSYTVFDDAPADYNSSTSLSLAALLNVVNGSRKLQILYAYPFSYYRLLFLENGSWNIKYNMDENGWLELTRKSTILKQNVYNFLVNTIYSSRPNMYTDKYNVLRLGIYKSGIYFQYTSGDLSLNDTYQSVYNIPVLPNETYWISPFYDGVHVTFFDKKISYISGIILRSYGISNDYKFTVPNNAYYMAVSYSTISNDDFKIYPIEYFYGQKTKLDENNNKSYEVKKHNRNLIYVDEHTNRNYFSKNSGNYNAINDNYCSLILPVIEETEYSSYNHGMHISFFNNNNEYISGISDNDTFSFQTPQGAVSMRVSWRWKINDEIYDNLRLCIGSNGIYTEFGTGDVYEIAGSISRVLEVGTNKAYSTIAAAIDSAVDDDTILIYPGVYEETINAYSKNLNIKGINKSHCILTYSADNYITPPLHMAKGSVYNLTIKATWSGNSTNTRAYCVHIDNNNIANNELLFYNVDFISERGACVGIGLRANNHLRFERCLFKTTDTGVEGPIYLHSWETGDNDANDPKFANQNCTFIECIIINESFNHDKSAIILQSQEKLDKCCNLTFINNTVLQINSTADAISMILWQGRTNTNTNYLGSTDFVLTKLSYGNNISVMNYNNN